MNLKYEFLSSQYAKNSNPKLLKKGAWLDVSLAVPTRVQHVPFPPSIWNLDLWGGLQRFKMATYTHSSC